MRLILLVLCVVPSLLMAEPEKKLRWYLTDWPPAFILQGPDKGKGFAEELMDLIQKEMPNYKHERTFLPYRRILKNLERGDEGCYPINIYDNPNHYGLVSAPTTLVAGHNIYIHKSNLDQFPSGDTVSLTELLKNQKLRLGVRADLEFGPILSPILKAHEGQANLVLRQNQDLVDGLIRMLEHGHIDYFIEYHLVVKYTSKKLGFDMNDYLEIPIKENREEYIRGSIECPDNEWGRGIIADINEVLHRIRGTEAFRDINNRWFVSKAVKKVYWGKYKELILDVSK